MANLSILYNFHVNMIKTKLKRNALSGSEEPFEAFSERKE